MEWSSCHETSHVRWALFKVFDELSSNFSLLFLTWNLNHQEARDEFSLGAVCVGGSQLVQAAA